MKLQQFSSFVACMVAATAVAAPDVVVQARNLVDRASYDGTPVLSWEASDAPVTVQRSADGGATWTDVASLAAGAAEFADASAQVSRTYRYRLSDEAGTGAASADFQVLRFLDASRMPVVSVGDFASQSWCKRPGLAFDGSIAADSYPDSATSKPQVGVDFGAASNYVRRVRLYPRTSNNCQGRMNHTRIYGYGGAWSTEADNAGTALTEELTGVAENRWYELESDASVAYRYYYFQGATGGNVAECEFWGWTAEDLEALTRVDLAFQVERSDWTDSYAVVTADAAHDGAEVQRKTGWEGEWTRVGVLAEGRFVDRTAPFGQTVYYRLVTAAGESASQSFQRLRRLSVEGAELFTDGPLDQPWCQPVSKAFDGDVGTFPDINKSRPKIGVDFGRPDVYVAFIRIHSRQGTRYRFVDTALYGSNDSAAMEIASGTVGKPLTDGAPLPGEDAPGWFELAVHDPQPLRTYYLTKTSGDFNGNVTEWELYGWTRADEGSETPLDFRVQRESFETFLPVLTWNDVSKSGVVAQRAESAEGPWTDLARVAPGEDCALTDRTVRYGRLNYYRLVVDGVPTEAVPFRRLRRMPVVQDAVFGNHQSAWNNATPWMAFDGNENSFPDLIREDGTRPKVGVDFGTDDWALALVRVLPRHESGNNIHLSAGAIFYGSRGTAAEEAATGAVDAATPLTKVTAFTDYNLEWQLYDVASPDYFRTYFYHGCYAGNLAEVEFYGWLRTDLVQPTTIFLR